MALSASGAELPPLGVVVEAIDFAARLHSKQRHKPIADTYVNHLTGVARILTSEGHVFDSNVIAAAMLRDVVEDTDCTAQTVRDKFGPNIASIVHEVTDDKGMSAPDRKRLQVEQHVRAGSYGAKLVIMAEKLYNCRVLMRKAPPTWTLERVKGYFIWALFVVDGARHVNGALAKAFDDAMRLEFKYGGDWYPCLPTTDREQLRERLERYYDRDVQATKLT